MENSFQSLVRFEIKAVKILGCLIVVGAIFAGVVDTMQRRKDQAFADCFRRNKPVEVNIQHYRSRPLSFDEQILEDEYVQKIRIVRKQCGE